MGAAKRLAVVQQEPPIGEVQGRHGHSKALRNGPAHRQVEGRVRLKMCLYVAGSIRESRSVVKIPTGQNPIRQVEVEPGM